MSTFDLGPWLGILGQGLWVTVYTMILGSILATVVAFGLGLLALRDRLLPRTIARVIIEFFRGTSLVVQLFWIAYALPILTGYKLDNKMGAIVALGLNFGAYGAEVVRGSIKSVPRPQREACVALSLGPVRAFWHVILPQALPLMIPPAGNLAVQLIKSTPLMFLVGVVDLYTVGDMMRQSQSHSVGLISIGLMGAFFLLSMAALGCTQLLENWAKRRLGQRPQRINTAVLAGAETPGNPR